MQWLNMEGITIIVILLLSVVANILFVIVVYKIIVRLLNNTRVGMKLLGFLLSLLACIPFVMALHRFTIFFMLHNIAYLWLLVMILVCAGLAYNLKRLTQKMQ
ncbi:MAG: hypothetical protein ACP5JP_00140 [bacterium]